MQPGDVLGTVDETAIVVHKILVPAGVSGTIEKIEDGDFNITETVAVIAEGEKKHEVCMLTKWPGRYAGIPHAEVAGACRQTV